MAIVEDSNMQQHQHTVGDADGYAGFHYMPPPTAPGSHVAQMVPWQGHGSGHRASRVLGELGVDRIE